MDSPPTVVGKPVKSWEKIEHRNFIAALVWLGALTILGGGGYAYHQWKTMGASTASHRPEDYRAEGILVTLGLLCAAAFVGHFVIWIGAIWHRRNESRLP